MFPSCLTGIQHRQPLKSLLPLIHPDPFFPYSINIYTPQFLPKRNQLHHEVHRLFRGKHRFPLPLHGNCRRRRRGGSSELRLHLRQFHFQSSQSRCGGFFVAGAGRWEVVVGGGGRGGCSAGERRELESERVCLSNKYVQGEDLTGRTRFASTSTKDLLRLPSAGKGGIIDALNGGLRRGIFIAETVIVLSDQAD